MQRVSGLRLQDSLIIPLMALASCGGDSSLSDAGAPTAVVTPTPTPTPTSTVAYTAASDFSRDRSFDAIGMTQTYSVGGAVFTVDSPQQENSSVGFEYTSADRGYKVRYNGSLLTAQPAVQKTDPFVYDHWDDGSYQGGLIPISYDANGTAVYSTNSSFDRSPLRVSINSSGNYVPSVYSGFALWKQFSYTANNTRGFVHYYLFGARTI
ncbi:hypothetical protein [Sphingomonas sp. GC_Shp_3]|uniref:hypothetical protein n=1 Tax=Sphingomonas sp. GC_Shp_3 TaxID=2937383 RepID=UPI00226A8B3A|nr:hypothetical protein [Sphingomonas sp. GC_Shp_3]